MDSKYNNKYGYRQFEYVNEELPHLLTCADIVISRAGSNTIFELLALKKPNLLIPLSSKSSRGDQILNAQSFEKRGFSMVLKEEDLNDNNLLSKLDELYKNKEKFIKNMENNNYNNAIDTIINIIEKYSL